VTLKRKTQIFLLNYYSSVKKKKVALSNVLNQRMGLAVSRNAISNIAAFGRFLN
jgi:hypothetical protein